jgi:hypothetical protein
VHALSAEPSGYVANVVHQDPPASVLWEVDAGRHPAGASAPPASMAGNNGRPDLSLPQWSAPAVAGCGWTPAGDSWDRGLRQLLTEAADPWFSAVHLVPADRELLVRRAVHGFSSASEARQHAVESGWLDFAVRSTSGLPAELRPDAP